MNLAAIFLLLVGVAVGAWAYSYGGWTGVAGGACGVLLGGAALAIMRWLVRLR